MIIPPFISLPTPSFKVQLGVGANSTAVLVLAAPLDKEGREGVGGLAVRVGCSRRNSSEAGFTIPVSIRYQSVCVWVRVGEGGRVRGT